MSSLRIDLDVEMTTRDGVTLRADVYRPETDAPVPAVVMRTPYDKSARHVKLGGFSPVTAARNGFAFVVQDVRGRWASDGEYKPISRVECADGYDCIEWVASQPWCTGAVGTVGVSYESLAQLMAAEEQPPSLKAIVPEFSGDSVRGSLLLDSILVGWCAGQAMDWIQKKMATGEASEDDLAVVMAAVRDPQAAAQHRPPADMPLMKVGSLFDYAEMLDLLRSASGTDFSKVQVPAMFIGGWYDIDANGVSRLFEGIRRDGATERARQDSAVVWGAWEHGMPYEGLGERHFGNLAGAGGKQLVQHYLRFFNRHLRGDDSSNVPTATYFMMGVNEWRESENWPPPGVEWRDFYLASSGGANTESGDGFLSDSPSSATADTDTFVYDPSDPSPSFGGRNFSVGGSRPGPFDQRRIETRADVLVYTSAPVEHPLEVIGDARLRLFASSSAVDTDFVVKICDVDPAGLSHNISDAFLRARWRDGFDAPSFLEPGDVYEFVVELGPVGHVFLPGHSVRVHVTSSAFPGFDRNMNTALPEGTDAVGVVATQCVWHTAERPSRLEIQVNPSEETSR